MPLMTPKRCLFILRAYPLKAHDLQEVFDQVLTFKAFDLFVSLLFLDASVKFLDQGQEGQQPGLLGLLDALAFYGVDQMLVEEESLLDHQLSLERLLIPVTVIARSDCSDLILEHDLVLAG